MDKDIESENENDEANSNRLLLEDSMVLAQ